MQPNFNTQQDWENSLRVAFGPYANSADPLLAFMKVAVERDMPPQDAVYFWLKGGQRNSPWFKLGLRSQRELLTLITKKCKAVVDERKVHDCSMTLERLKAAYNMTDSDFYAIKTALLEIERQRHNTYMDKYGLGFLEYLAKLSQQL